MDEGRGRSARRRATTAWAAVALVVAGAVPAAAQDGDEGHRATAVPSPPAAAVVPTLDWGPCPDEYPDDDVPVDPRLECTGAAVPLDHDEPAGPTIELALKRLPAADPGARTGSLFVNPGGPGGSGVDFVEAAEAVYAPEVLARFDVVGFDPRGVARSAPLTCFPDLGTAFDVLGDVPAFPVTTLDEVVTTRAYRRYTSSCTQDRDAVLDHMSTADVARDLDLLRAAVGDDGLTYVGYSYGSQLGTTYANLFPDRVRALVVDGVLDPVAWTTGSSPRQARTEPFSTRIGSAEGASATLGAFFAECEAAGPDLCALAGDGDTAARYAALARALREEPLELDLGDGFVLELGYTDLVSATLSLLYDAAAYPLLAEALAAVEDVVDVRGAGAGAVGAVVPAAVSAHAGAAWSAVRAAVPEAVVTGDDEPGDDEPGEEGPVQVTEGFDGVACADSDNPVRQRAWSRAGESADARAPYFGRLWTWASIACATWPGDGSDRYAGPWDAQTAAPVLVVGTRFDPATRYEGAQAVADLLPSSRLLTLEGWGHTSLLSSVCVDAAVTAYLVDLDVPADGATCEADRRPFDPLPEESTVAGLDEGDEVQGAEPEDVELQDAKEQVVADNLPVALHP